MIATSDMYAGMRQALRHPLYPKDPQCLLRLKEVSTFINDKSDNHESEFDESEDHEDEYKEIRDILEEERKLIRKFGLCALEKSVPFITKDKTETDQAIDVCRECELQDLCGAYSILAGERKGVWGGMSENTRKMIRSSIAGSVGARMLIMLGKDHPTFEDFIVRMRNARDFMTGVNTGPGRPSREDTTRRIKAAAEFQDFYRNILQTAENISI